MESKQLYTERHLFGQNYHLNKNLHASLPEFKVKIKKWKCDTCPCRLCKKFQPNLGFINQKYGFKKCEFALFYYIFKKKLKNDITHQKNYKAIIENVFSQPQR